MITSSIARRNIRSAAATERQMNPNAEIPGSIVPIVHRADPPQFMSCRILNLFSRGARLRCEAPLSCDRVLLTYTADRHMIVEADVVWSDFASAGPDDVVYGVSFDRVLSSSDFTELIGSLTLLELGDELDALVPSSRELEESLFALFRGHSPQGARSQSVG